MASVETPGRIAEVVSKRGRLDPGSPLSSRMPRRSVERESFYSAAGACKVNSSQVMIDVRPVTLEGAEFGSNRSPRNITTRSCPRRPMAAYGSSGTWPCPRPET